MGDLTLGLKPKKYECSNGHKWEDIPDTTSMGAGWEMRFYDPRVDKIHEMSLKLGPYCNICLYERIKEVMAGTYRVGPVGIVTEQKSDIK